MTREQRIWYWIGGTAAWLAMLSIPAAVVLAVLAIWEPTGSAVYLCVLFGAMLFLLACMCALNLEDVK